MLLARKHRPTSAAVPARWHVSVGAAARLLLLHVARALLAEPRARRPGARGAARAAARTSCTRSRTTRTTWSRCSARGSPGGRASPRRTAPTPCSRCSPRATPRRARWTYARLARLIAVSGYTRAGSRALAAGGAVPPATLSRDPNAVDAAPLPRRRAQLAGDAPLARAALHADDRRAQGAQGASTSRSRPGAAWRRASPDLHHFVVGQDAAATTTSAASQARADAAGLAGARALPGQRRARTRRSTCCSAPQVFLHTPVTAAATAASRASASSTSRPRRAATPAIGTLDCGRGGRASSHGVTGSPRGAARRGRRRGAARSCWRDERAARAHGRGRARARARARAGSATRAPCSRLYRAAAVAAAVTNRA